MSFPTHARIDGANHLVSTVELAAPGSAHTHRVRFACGILFDVRGEHEFELHAMGRRVAATSSEVNNLQVAAVIAQELAAKARDTFLELLALDVPTAARDRWRDSVDEAERAHTQAYLAGALANERYHNARVVGDQRWITGGKALGCERCCNVEVGRAEPVPARSSERAVRLADIPIGLACPVCGGEIRIRRYAEGAACTQGHDYTIPEVQLVAAGVLERLARGKV